MPIPRSSPAMIAQAIWRYTANHHGKLFILLVVSLLGRSVDLAAPYVIGEIINAIQNFEINGTERAIQWVLILALVRFASMLCDSPANALELYLGKRSEFAFVQEFYNKARHMPLLWHQDNHSGDVISRLNKGSSAITFFIQAPYQILWLTISFFGPIIILYQSFPKIGLMILSISMIAMISGLYIDRIIEKLSIENNALTHRIYASLTDYIGNIRTIITLRLGTQTENDIQQRMTHAVQNYNTEIKWRFKRWISVDSCVELTLLLAIAFAIYAFQNNSSNTMKIGDLVMIITYLRLMSMAVYNATRYSISVTDNIANYRSIQTIADDYEAHQRNLIQDDIIYDKTWSKIDVQDLSFAYGIRNALNNISFKLQSGQKIALVGTSGAGKSTLMSVLRGLYPSQSDTLIIDNTAYDSLRPLASLSTLIPQEPEIFENTIRYNVTLGLEHSDDEIMEACRIACFDTVVRDLPNGLDSKINEKGVNLSGGQKQRLALARGIFAIEQSSIVLFDEPTSSIDSVTERRLYQNLFTAFPDICLISSIHRLNLLPLFDTIWVMENGKLVQQGSLPELLAQKNAVFHQLWSAYQQNADES